MCAQFPSIAISKNQMATERWTRDECMRPKRVHHPVSMNNYFLPHARLAQWLLTKNDHYCNADKRYPKLKPIYALDATDQWKTDTFVDNHLYPSLNWMEMQEEKLHCGNNRAAISVDVKIHISTGNSINSSCFIIDFFFYCSLAIPSTIKFASRW